jgi:hypothetical protein
MRQPFMIDSSPKISVLALVLTLIIQSTSASAQEFFPEGFVQQHFEGGGVAKPKPQAPSKTTLEPLAPSTAAMQNLALMSHPLASQLPIPDRMVGIVYVNSLNRDHFEGVITKVLDIQRKRKIQIYGVFHIGDYKNVSDKRRSDLERAGIFILQIDKMPADVPATLSPAWGIMTPESQRTGSAYLIEGYMEPQIFFNQSGQFQIPPGMEVGGDTQREGRLSQF